MTELDLVRLAVALGGAEYGGPLSGDERELVHQAEARDRPAPSEVQRTAAAIRAGSDPLGNRLIAMRTQADRRPRGQVFTPDAILGPMVEWALGQAPTRIVDPGCGSGRFTLAAARRSKAEIVAIDVDPVATLLTRGGLAALRRPGRVLNADYTQAPVPPHAGRTAFVGNPPYVRHHDVSPALKAWGQRAAERLGVRLSRLAGLHAYFFVATALHGRSGDIGCFVTSSEWLDVNYGAAVRQLLLDGLGGRSISVIDAAAAPFGETAATAAVTCFELGSKPGSIRLREVGSADDLARLASGHAVPSKRLAQARRWMPLARPARGFPEGFVELGEICRVHRGQVTGANDTWVVGPGDQPTVPERYLRPSVTRARELFDAGERLDSAAALKRVIDLPPDLDMLEAAERREVEVFLDSARAAGVADGYVARHRKAWWAVGLREPAPILATYMARRPPTFVRNASGACHINIAHGIYPREPLPEYALDRLAAALRSSVRSDMGRTYAGGLVKFEPREMERIPVPPLDQLLAEG